MISYVSQMTKERMCAYDAVFKQVTSGTTLWNEFSSRTKISLYRGKLLIMVTNRVGVMETTDWSGPG